jgi:hypothetical protein
VTGEAADFFSCRDVPKLEGRVVAAGQRIAAVGRERDRYNVFGMAGKGADLLSRRSVPELERLVEAAGQRSTAVGRERDRNNV